MRLVLAVDGSPSSEQARDLTASLPWPAGTSITLVMAVDVPTAWFPEGGGVADERLAEAEQALRREAEASLGTMAPSLERPGWTIDRRVVPGRAAQAILGAADEVHADLIVLGSRGHGAIASMLLGSVSAEVAADARCSVLVARAPAVSRLLVATDGSTCAGILPDILAGWEAFRGMSSISLSVAPVDSPGFELLVHLYTMGGLSLEDERQQLRERHRGYAAELADRLSAAGIPAHAELRTGDAAHEIIQEAARADADLVVTGSRCLHGLDRWLLGSVARDVLLHAHASVLVVRRPDLPAGSNASM